MAPTKFIILTSPRSGSTYLQGLLNSHQGAYCMGEIFSALTSATLVAQHLRDSLNDQRQLGVKIPLAVFRARLRDPVGYMRCYLDQASPAYRAVGYRLFYYHLNPPPDHHVETPRAASFWRHVAQSADLRTIQLRRRNLLRKLVSLTLARQTGVWVLRRRLRWFWSAMASVQPRNKIVLTRDRCEYWFGQLRDTERAHASRLPAERLLTVNYEDLLGEPETQESRILRFLDLEPGALSTSLVRQAQRPVRDVLDNYDELKESFRNTEWEQFFDE